MHARVVQPFALECVRVPPQLPIASPQASPAKRMRALPACLQSNTCYFYKKPFKPNCNSIWYVNGIGKEPYHMEVLGYAALGEHRAGPCSSSCAPINACWRHCCCASSCCRRPLWSRPLCLLFGRP